jgi:hypothetical protein
MNGGEAPGRGSPGLQRGGHTSQLRLTSLFRARKYCLLVLCRAGNNQKSDVGKSWSPAGNSRTRVTHYGVDREHTTVHTHVVPGSSHIWLTLSTVNTHLMAPHAHDKTSSSAKEAGGTTTS